MSWFNSLDSVVRIQYILSWIGIVSAVLAAVCGVLAYYLNNQARALNARQIEESVTQEAPEASGEEGEAQAAEDDEAPGTADTPDGGEDDGRAAHAVQITQLEGQIEQLRADLKRSDEEAEEASIKLSQAQEEAQSLKMQLEELRQEAEQLEDRAEEAEEAAEEAQQSLEEEEEAEQIQFINAMRDKPSGPLDIVAVEGVEGSRRTAEELQALLERAGWDQVQVREGQFEGTPEGVYFVVHSQTTMPEYAAPLAIGLATIDLMPMPARVKANPNKSPGYLGIVIGVR